MALNVLSGPPQVHRQSLEKLIVLSRVALKSSQFSPKSLAATSVSLLQVHDYTTPYRESADHQGSDSQVLVCAGAVRVVIGIRFSIKASINELGVHGHIKFKEALIDRQRCVDDTFVDEERLVGVGRAKAIQKVAGPHGAASLFTLNKAELLVGRARVVLEILVKSKSKRHADSLSTKRPAAAFLTGAKVMNGQEDEAVQDGKIRLSISSEADLTSEGGPFLAASERVRVGSQLGAN